MAQAQPEKTPEKLATCIRHGKALHNVLSHRRGFHLKIAGWFGPFVHDAPLMQEGHNEAHNLGLTEDSEPTFKDKVEIVYVSSMSRPMQTMSGIWKKEIEGAGFTFPEWTDMNVEEEGSRAWLDKAEAAWKKTSELIDVHGKFSSEKAAQMREGMRVKFLATDLLREWPLGMACNNRRKRSELEPLFPWIDFSDIPEEDESVWRVCGYPVPMDTNLRKRVGDFKQLLLNHPKKGDRLAVVGHSYHLQELLQKSKGLEHCKPYDFVAER